MRPKLATIMMGRRLHLSAHTPTNSPKTGKASICRAPRIPISKGPAPSRRIATVGNASPVTCLPKAPTVSLSHSRRKSACLQSPPSVGNSKSDDHRKQPMILQAVVSMINGYARASQLGGSGSESTFSGCTAKEMSSSVSIDPEYRTFPRMMQCDST